MPQSRRDQGDSGGGDRPQDSWVSKLRPDPGRPAARTLTLTGLIGDSDRAGYRRLYFTRALDQYAEFRADDVLAAEDVPVDTPPFVGLDATRVTLTRDAVVDYTRSVPGDQATDPFDLDARFTPAAASSPRMPTPQTRLNTCNMLCFRTELDTCQTCATNCGTCQTCATCNNCTATCDTQCGTCQTCHNVCDPTQATCATQCATQCGTCNCTNVCQTEAQTHCVTCRCNM
jgi:hypothetical protein